MAPKTERRDGKDVMKEGPKWIVFHELIQTSKEYMRQVIEIKGEWLSEIAPHLYKKKDVEDDTTTKKKKMPKGSGLAPTPQ